MKAWHFIDGDKLRDGTQAPADGVPLVHTGPLKLCNQGLHASTDAFDALGFAPGDTLCLVECEGDIVYGDDKLVCSRRTIIARMDAAPLLRHFARQQALSVLHLYPGNPGQCVLDWLMGDDTQQVAAARSAVHSAAYWEAHSATCSAADSEACSAAGSAARSAAYSAARSAAYSAAASATYSAAYSAARSAACPAAASAAYSAAYSAARSAFNSLVADAFQDWLP